MYQELNELTLLIQQFTTTYKNANLAIQEQYQANMVFYQDFTTFHRTSIPPSSLELARKKLNLVIAKILETQQQLA
ncbi:MULTISPECIES: hypothetical protein [unclassified Aureispira]|uniref:hypothetical protein n=1 Tax=unclassified Aureispira TaxID=2649989 RepID=UPI000698F791|nr:MULTISPECIES: hypothetical protein [unclassified Aureispira]WMX14998.1 hypothetical protein QP953_01280 [Aureispira sp. CCB-E]